jgi:hypothetical protein
MDAFYAYYYRTYQGGLDDISLLASNTPFKYPPNATPIDRFKMDLLRPYPPPGAIEASYQQVYPNSTLPSFNPLYIACYFNLGYDFISKIPITPILLMTCPLDHCLSRLAETEPIRLSASGQPKRCSAWYIISEIHRLNYFGPYGESPLHLIVSHFVYLGVLMEPFLSMASKTDPNLPLSETHAVKRVIYRRMVTMGDEFESTPLHCAVESASLDAARALINLPNGKIPLLQFDNQGENPLLKSIRFMSENRMKKRNVYEQYRAIALYLISIPGAAVVLFQRDQYGMLPLHRAVGNGIAETLMETMFNSLVDKKQLRYIFLLKGRGEETLIFLTARWSCVDDCAVLIKYALKINHIVDAESRATLRQQEQQQQQQCSNHEISSQHSNKTASKSRPNFSCQLLPACNNDDSLNITDNSSKSHVQHHLNTLHPDDEFLQSRPEPYHIDNKGDHDDDHHNDGENDRNNEDKNNNDLGLGPFITTRNIHIALNSPHDIDTNRTQNYIGDFASDTDQGVYIDDKIPVFEGDETGQTILHYSIKFQNDISEAIGLILELFIDELFYAPPD